ncbi:Phosphate regulon transcriptional regulatory protein PhoB (SphR) [Labilithrix luteola]|uniref:Phosphate regulon transcriptional regulatory protein PhoB (SphR) n=1 Tax=Labilithrix luteola TaxID=1391654 RepID=A0A0K1QDE1_9BACT|nr:response regulator [Labilithrix luteola]AKV03450.1 Phosphate regulon transcriptional regulatory protein PhoB (SphR) [Labilithrix luteola]
MSDDKKPIGRILLKRRLISQEELDKQLASQAKAHDGVPLASRIAASGVVEETDVLRALSEQLGVPGIDLNQIAIPIEYLDLVPREVAESSRLLPVLARDDRLFLAMGNPRDQRAIDELEFVTGKRVFPYVAITSTLERAIGDAYDAKDLGATYYAGPKAPPEALERIGVSPEQARYDRERAELMPREPAPMAVSDRRGITLTPDAAPVFVDEQIQRAGENDDLSTSDFGTLGEEVSRVELLTEELRNAAGLTPSPEQRGKRILVVDDEEDIRKLVRRLLTDEGHQVIEADRGLVALNLVKEHTPDLILLDAMLPELHGFDIARRMKGSEKYGKIPILMMSAVYRGWRIVEDLKSTYGIDDYIEKPFRIKELLAKTTRLLERSESGMASHDPEQIDRTAAKLLEDGIAAYKAGNAELAMSLLKKGIALDPLAYRLRYHLALIYGKCGQIYDGITELERAVDLNPRHFPALKNLAVLYEKAGFRNKAVEMWERCLHVAPDPETRESIKAHLFKLF